MVVERSESVQRMQQSAHHTTEPGGKSSLSSVVSSKSNIDVLTSHVCNPLLSPSSRHHTNGLHENKWKDAAVSTD